MKKLVLIVMLFLLPLQYTWAMVASYDAHGNKHNSQNSSTHFGHHEHPAGNLLTSKLLNDDNDSSSEKAPHQHDHYGYSHLSCLELLSHHLPCFTAKAEQFLTQYDSYYHAPPSHALERPNWFAAV